MRAGHPYFVLCADQEIAVTEAGHEAIVADRDIDLLEHLTEPIEWALSFDRRHSNKKVTTPGTS